jgi:hypothetical protein
LAGLNIDFDEVKGQVIGRQPLPPLNEVFVEVRREESRRLVMLGKKGRRICTCWKIYFDCLPKGVCLQDSRAKSWG